MKYVEREIQFRPQLVAMAERLKEACKESDPPCSKCANQISFMRAMMLAGLPYARVKTCLGKLDPIKAAEFDPVNESVSKEIDLIGDFIVPYLEHHEEVFEKGLSILLSGTNETGKTTAAVYLAMKMIVNKCKNVHYITLRNLYAIYLEFIKGDDMGARSLLGEIENVDFLVIDEIAKEAGRGESSARFLEDIVKHREENLLPTVLVTNLGINRFAAPIENGGYGPSTWNAMKQRYSMFVFPDEGVELRSDHRVRRSF